MQQLSGSDTGFLYAEQGNNYNHVAGLALYDPSTAPVGQVRFKDILTHFDARMHRNPLFRRRLVEAPLGIDRPYWVDTPDFDVEFHVRHIALPEPGDWRQLMIQVARLHARPLDRSRPLWEMYVIGGLDKIPGLPKGCFALFYKMHHAAVDGMASLHVMSQLHSNSPDAEDLSAEEKVIVTDRYPNIIELASRAAMNGGRRALALSQLSVSSSRKLLNSFGQTVRSDELAEPPHGTGNWLEKLNLKAPSTRFNKKISAHRVVEGVGLPMDAIKALRAAVKGVTVNDVFLAVVGGSMRRYLEEKGELPEQTLVTMMPISLRSDASAGGNSVGVAATELHTNIEDPLQRLLACHKTASAKKGSDNVLSNELPVLADNMPSFLTDLLTRHWLAPSMNTVVSNVRGPGEPLYIAGAELQRLYPVSIPTDHIGINHTGVSYAGQMWLGVVACRDMLPDPAFYAQCIRDSFNEMLVAAGVSPVADSAFTNAPEASVKPGRKVS